jgi:UDP-N-acetylmuramoylalanine--D-glutamate ligase
MKIKELEKKNLLILGIGREGLDSFLFLRKLFPKKLISIADAKNIEDLDSKTEKLLSKDDYIKYYGGKDYLKSLKNFDIIIKSPGIQFEKIKYYLGVDTLITSQTDLFFDNCPGKIVGITGTKGKSTTSSLIYNVLKKNGINAYLIGNIENPSLSYLLKAKKSDVFVYEMSAHQLQFLKISPQISVFLNIYPEHLDYYKTFKEYFNAKANIALYQTSKDYFIYNSKLSPIKNLAVKTKAKKIAIEPSKYSKLISEFKNITHEDNLAAIFEVGKIFKLTSAQIEKGIKTFKGLPHRLERIGKYKGIQFYDDSISTIPESAIYALDTLGDKVETMILGGMDRGIEFKKISERIGKSKIKNLVFLPTSGKKIWQGIKKEAQKKMQHFFVNSMDEAVKIAFEKTNLGAICLMSPASPSYNMFKDFKDRGDQFKKLVKQYGSSKEN